MPCPVIWYPALVGQIAHRGSRRRPLCRANITNTYFNLGRRYSALSYRSLHQFERDFQLRLSYCTVRFYWTTPLLKYN